MGNPDKSCREFGNLILKIRDCLLNFEGPSVKYYESYTKSDIYTFWYNFDTVLYQFLETGTSDRCIFPLQSL